MALWIFLEDQECDQNHIRKFFVGHGSAPPYRAVLTSGTTPGVRWTPVRRGAVGP